MSDWKRGRPWFLAALGWVFVAMAPGCGREDPDDLSYRIRVDFAAGRLAKTEADFAQLARIRPLTVAERLLRSQVASDRGRIDEALTVLAEPRGPTTGPDAALIASGRGQLEMDRYRFRAAETELKRALTLDPGRVEARRRLIMLYAQQGRSAEIAAQAPALLSMATPDFLDLFFCTLARHQPIDRAEQAEALEQAVQADPGDRASQLALAECLRRLGRLDQAESNLDLLPPTDPEVLAVRALVALDRGDSLRAQALLGADSPAGDDHPALARLLGRLALARDDAAAAVRHFRAALKAAPDDRDAHFGLAQALRLTGQPETARPHADTVRAQDRLESLVKSARRQNRRDHPATLQAIAEACLALDRRDEARAWYRLALSHDPDNDQLKNALSRLGSTQSSTR
jgi:tetratricopeptide (TPR) repeat protein